MPPPTAWMNRPSAGLSAISGGQARQSEAQCACSNVRRSWRTPPRKRPARWPELPVSMSPNSRSASVRTQPDRPSPLAATTIREGRIFAQPVAAILPVAAQIRRFASQHRAPDALAAERGFEQMVVDEVVGRIDALAQFGQDDLFLALQILLVEVRRADEIGDELSNERHVARRARGRETRSGPAQSRR